MKTYTLLGADGRPFAGTTPGALVVTGAGRTGLHRALGSTWVPRCKTPRTGQDKC